MRKHLLSILLVSIYCISFVFMLSGCNNNSQATEATTTISDFSFHNGIKFGMNKEEAIKFEEENNEAIISKYAIYPGLDGVWGNTSFLDNPEAPFNFCFDNDDKLVSATFVPYLMSRTNSTYKEINQTLSSKYGRNIAINGKYYKFTTNGNDALTTVTSFGFQNSQIAKIETEDISEYFVKIDDGYAVIYTVLYSYTPSIEKYYGVVISYSFVSNEDYEKMIADQVQSEKEKKEKEEEREQKRNNDL